MRGYVKLRRSLLEWEWYDDHNATRLLIHLLVSVNYQDKRWKGTLIKKGSIALSWNTLSEGCGLSVKQCRTAMKKLESSGEVARLRAGRYQLVSLVKWDKMQIEEVHGAVKGADKGQDEGRMRATTKESKEYKEREEERKGTALDFLNTNQKSGLETFVMQNKSLVNDWERMVDNFNDTVEIEKLEWDVKVLFPRLKKYCRNWISKQADRKSGFQRTDKYQGIL
jgi:hypothetical protein